MIEFDVILLTGVLVEAGRKGRCWKCRFVFKLERRGLLAG